MTAVVFDGDDTLWSTERLYDEARSAARAIVAACRLDAERWEALERRMDVENVAHFGYSSQRFPTSCVQAYEAVAAHSQQAPDTTVAERIRAAASTVFARDPPLVSGALETVSVLRARGVRLALLTKGEHQVQLRRIECSGLAAFFDVIEIVPEKTPETIRFVVATLGIEPSAAWMVGNSVRSDILPALAAGLHAIWIDAHVWEHERTHDHLVDDRVVVATALADILEVIKE